MSSRAQKKANRANAQKSSGPRTAQGRAAAAQNARRHGLAGGFAILAYEDKDEFQRLLAHYIDDYQPTGTAEQFLVEQMAKSQWTLARAGRIEACLVGYLAGCEQEDSPDLNVAIDIAEKSKEPILTVERYRAAAERTYHRSKRELEQTRLRRARENRQQERVAPQRQVPYHQQVMSRNQPVRNEPNRPFSPAANPGANAPARPSTDDDGGNLYPNAYRSLAREALERARARENDR